MPSHISATASAAFLHARPASTLAQTVVRSGYSITIARPGDSPVNAGNLIALVTLGLSRGEEVTIACDNDAAVPTMQVIATIIRGDYAPNDQQYRRREASPRIRSA